MSENDFLDTVVHLAKLRGWLVYHARPAQVRPGVWRTPYTGDRGFPDLVLVHQTHGIIFAELKTQTGRLSVHQRAWLDTLQKAGREAYCWRPDQLPLIAQRLAGDPV